MSFMRQFIVMIMIGCIFSCVMVLGVEHSAASSQEPLEQQFPKSLDGYDDSEIDTIVGKLKKRIQIEPFNFFATTKIYWGA
jgi:hypothetical protein